MAFEATSGLGTRVNYGVRETEQKFGGKIGDGVEHYAQWVFDYDSLPVAGAEMEALIPANSLIRFAYFQVIDAFTGGTSVDIGLQTTAGVEIDNNGLFAGLALASMTPAGKWTAGAGALVAASTGANAGNLVVTPTGTFTAGKGRVVIEYIPALV